MPAKTKESETPEYDDQGRHRTHPRFQEQPINSNGPDGETLPDIPRVGLQGQLVDRDAQLGPLGAE